MFATNLKIIEELKQFISLVNEQSEVLKQFTNCATDFSRERKLTFPRLVLLIGKLCKKTLSVELDKFFEELETKITCTVSAFTQQRKKLQPLFYKSWNEVLLLSFYYHYEKNVKRWKGYRLIASDGSTVSLVNTPVLQKYFGGQSNQQCSFVLAKTFYCYDILNSLTIAARIEPYRTGELPMAYDNINNIAEDMLMIYDRNYFNFKMMALHTWHTPELKFVIRAKDSSLIVRSFLESKVDSAIVQLPATSSALAELPKNGYHIDKNSTLKIRLVRVELPHTIEVLATNLWEEDQHTAAELKELYFKRWTIETNIGKQKNIFQLESFSGLTVHSVLQDFYATVFSNNLHAVLIKDAQRTIDSSKSKKKYPLKINNNKSHGQFRSTVIELFITKHPKIILEMLHRYFIRDPLPIRKGRSFARLVKNKQSKSKHKTFMNYKPAF
jgi:hypothetical protein